MNFRGENLDFSGKLHAFQPPVTDQHGLVFPDIQSLTRLACDQAKQNAAHRQPGDIYLSVGASEARQDLLRLASEFNKLTDQPDSALSCQTASKAAVPIIATGHQPELFHPGVWFKDFVAASMATAVSGIAVHLITDNDLMRHCSLRVPTHQADGTWLVREVAWDDPPLNLSCETYRPRDSSRLESFVKRVEASLDGAIPDPLLAKIWPRILGQHSRGVPFCYALAGTLLEEGCSVGAPVLGVPFGWLCQTSTFRRFADYFFRRASEFLEVHNQLLRAHRRQYRIRSRAHPVPELQVDEEWIEAPFWIFSQADPRRLPLFISKENRRRLRAGGIQGHDGWQTQLPNAWPQEGFDQVPAAFDEKLGAIHIRPRAIMTTTFARLFLCDLFIHGVGGAKYDLFTNALIQRFLQINPPIFAAATATFRLPLPVTTIDNDALRRHDLARRELLYHPEIAVQRNPAQFSPAVHALCARKQELVRDLPPKGNRRNWHAAVVCVQEQLGVQLAKERARLEFEQLRLWEEVQHSKALQSREFSSALFSSPQLAENLLDIARDSA